MSYNSNIHPSIQFDKTSVSFLLVISYGFIGNKMVIQQNGMIAPKIMVWYVLPSLAIAYKNICSFSCWNYQDFVPVKLCLVSQILVPAYLLFNRTNTF